MTHKNSTHKHIHIYTYSCQQLILLEIQEKLCAMLNGKENQGAYQHK